MSVNTFFVQNQILAEEISATTDCGCAFCLQLTEDDLHHANVLRLQAGEHIGVVDDAGVYYECEVQECSRSGLFVVNCHRLERSELPAEVWLCPGLAKGHKLDNVIRACTEIGVSGIIPVEFSRSVVHLDHTRAAKRVVRWAEIAKSAAMQSGARKIAQVNYVCTVNELCTELSKFDFVLIFWEEADIDQGFKNLYSLCKNFKQKYRRVPCVALAVGPEGGIESAEVDKIKQANSNTQVCSLGPAILRTETANVVACANVMYELRRGA